MNDKQTIAFLKHQLGVIQSLTTIESVRNIIAKTLDYVEREEPPVKIKLPAGTRVWVDVKLTVFHIQFKNAETCKAWKVLNEEVNKLVHIRNNGNSRIWVNLRDKDLFEL